MTDFPGTDRPWHEGDEVRLFFPHGYETIVVADKGLADELNRLERDDEGRWQPMRVGVVPEAVISDPGIRDIFDILEEQGDSMHYERLEHEWTLRSRKRGDKP